MKYFLLTAILSLLILPVHATTYSSQPLGPKETIRWGLTIVVSKVSSLSSDYTIAVNPEYFSRCRVSYVSIYTRDRNGVLVRSYYPGRIGAGYYFNIEESQVKTSSIELICEPKRTDRPGERYTIELSAYVE